MIANLFRLGPIPSIQPTLNPELAQRWRRIELCKWFINAHLVAWVGMGVYCLLSLTVPGWSALIFLGGFLLHQGLEITYKREHESLFDDTREYALTLMLAAESQLNSKVLA